MAGWLLARVLPFAAILNVAINLAVGRAVYRPGRAVPLAGDPSIAGDTLVNAFIIGFCTLLAVMPAARREARAGRVRGRARKARWLSWPKRRPIVCAIAFGLLSSLVLGGALVGALAAARVSSLPRDHFIALKAAFAGVAGVVTAIACAWLAVAPEPDVSDDPRWCRDPARPTGGVVYPCDYIDKGGVAVTDRARGCSGTPTWQLLVRGALEPAHVERALADVVARYPSLTTNVQALDGAPPLATRFRYAHDASFALAKIFEVVEARDADALESLARDVRNRHLDLFSDFPMTLTMARTGGGACRLLFRQHHALADGRAFIGLLGDFAAFLDAARAGRRPPAESLAPVGRRGELEALALGRWRRAADTAAGYAWLTGAVMRALARPLAPLQQNRSNDYTGENGTVHWLIADDALDGWNAARKRIGASLNSLLTGALFVANRAWHRSLGVACGRVTGTLQMETRPRDGTFVSFANHLATLDVEARLDRTGDPAAIVRAIQAQVDRQRARRTPIKRLLCERQLVSTMTIEQMQRFVFESKRPAYNLNFSNLIALEFPALGGDGWSVEDVLITTPVTPRTGIALTAIRYRGRLVFNFNYKSSAATREETEALCRHFQEALAALTGVEPRVLGPAC